MGLMNIKSGEDVIRSGILLLVGLSVLVQILPDVIAAIINFSTIANMPFSSFFAANGAALLMLGAGVLFAIFGAIGMKKSGR